MQEYSNNGFELNVPDYYFEDFGFIGTCGSFPEQYDIVMDAPDGKRCQYGYVRLRGGYLYCVYPDITCDDYVCIYEHQFEDKRGAFKTEEERLFFLSLIAQKLRKFIDGVSYEYS